ncbi:MAG: hypothetical protein LVQ75_05085 [Candidatus Babeliales bacterium]
MLNIGLFFMLLLNFFGLHETSCRSPLRNPNPLCPRITTQWAGNSQQFQLTDWHLEINALFHLYDKKHFIENLLPTDTIHFRNHHDQSIQGTILSGLIEELLAEVKKGKKQYKNFHILKNRDFNVKKQAGLLVVKCKDYPFVVKLFMETPRSFIRPYNKGFEPICFFIIGGGATRHFIGFTRIKNLLTINERIKKNSHWSKRVDTPRKWFWLPKEEKNILLTGYNIGGHEKIELEFPGIYAIVTDEIKASRKFSIFSSEDRATAIDLSNYLLCRIDPHIENFLIEKETDKILLIDTEHFPSLVGFKERPRITSYTSWYLHLFTKFIKNYFCRSKQARYDLQRYPTAPFSMP